MPNSGEISQAPLDGLVFTEKVVIADPIGLPSEKEKIENLFNSLGTAH